MGNLTVRPNRCLSMLAWVHLHWEARSLSETDTLHHPPLLASFIWQLWLPQKGRPSRTSSRADTPSAGSQPACVTSLQVPLVHLLKLQLQTCLPQHFALTKQRAALTGTCRPLSEVVPGAASECEVRYSFHHSRSQRCQDASLKLSLKLLCR